MRITRRDALHLLALPGGGWPALLVGYAAALTCGNDPSDGYRAEGFIFPGLAR